MRRALKFAGRALGVLALALAGLVGASAAVLAATEPPRGRMVDIGEGRRLRLVCEGPAQTTRPVVWFESGAWGIATDWASVQAKLAAEEYRSCAYDRAGLGYSDRGPSPRDADAVSADLERLVRASGEKGPFILVAHSAGGLYLRNFAGGHPDQVKGIVLVDAMLPEWVGLPQVKGFVSAFQGSSRLISWAATLGLTKPVALTGAPNAIGLPREFVPEKRRAMGSGRHNRAAAAEIRGWGASVEQGTAKPPFDPEWPVAVVTAKRDFAPGPMASVMELRAQPARVARRGRYDEVEGAGHTTLLGPIYGGRIVEAVKFVAGESVAD
jgi:pimeloyl-ACP methyl ester carboxylesterase